MKFVIIRTILNSVHKSNALRTLSKYWGFHDFRPLQMEIIDAVLNKHDTLALLPTGGGKSLCFQVPGLILGGTTLVISPLIALMNDQVQNLRNKGISALAITAAMNYKQIDIALTNAALGHVQFIYLSPERLQNLNFIQKLSHLPISLIAVDEAHCISQWGYDFRPSYLKIADLRSYFPDINIVALTASATESVSEDIQLKLVFKNSKLFRQSFARKNLRYVVQKEENKIARLLKLIHNIGGSGVVYVRNRKKTIELTSFLRKNAISCMAYHAGLNYDDRQQVQQHWLDNKIQVICATNAFGMGIDKPDVRFVVHLDLPDSLEAYFQEAGRAGRDGKPAYAALFFTEADIQKLDENFKLSFPSIEDIKQTYQAIGNYYQVAIGAGEDLSVPFDIHTVCKSYNLSPILVYNSIKFLEKENYLSLFDASFEPSKVMFVAGKEDIYQFELLNPNLEPLIKTLLRSYGGLFENFVFINEKDLAYRVKIPAVKVIEQLHSLTKQGLILYEPQSGLPKLIFLQNRQHIKYLEFNPDNYHKLKQQHEFRIQSVKDYVSNSHICRQTQLLIYFNEIDSQNCGYCDVCLAKKPKNEQVIREKILKLMEEKSRTLPELKLKFKKNNDETWLRVFNELVDDGLVKEEAEVYTLIKKQK